MKNNSGTFISDQDIEKMADAYGMKEVDGKIKWRQEQVGSKKQSFKDGLIAMRNLLAVNEQQPEDNMNKCAECEKEMDLDMEHNYGTPDHLCCIHCYNSAQENTKQ